MTSSAFGQIEAGGVSSDSLPAGTTTWYAGEGLKQGDFFSVQILRWTFGLKVIK